MPISRMAKCLLTLSAKPEIAYLVRSFCFFPPFFFHALRAFRTLLTRALSNMTNLHTLLLRLGKFATPSTLSQMTCQLKKLYCVFLPKYSYLASQLVSTQPTIEELTIISPSVDLFPLDPNALPMLRKLSATLQLLPSLFPSRLSHLSRLSIIEPLTNPEGFIRLATAFKLAQPPESLHLVVGVDMSTHMVLPEVVSLGLALIGLVAPFICWLGVNVDKEHIGQEELWNMFAFALPRFPNLIGLALQSPFPTPGTYICDSHQAQPSEALSDTITLLHNALVSMSNTPVDISSLFPASQPTPNQTLDQPNSTPHALYDESCHMKILNAWRQINPKLQHVVFSTKYAYTYVDENNGWTGLEG
ncbi:hypothetical protein FRC11_014613 [Ceratobasidium sp. 423]|nr:hypothetical protein FRC11_014613 [Ceratobasidium sp. 423]